MLIRHSAVELRRENMDRVPKVLCVLCDRVPNLVLGKKGEVGERELVLVVSVRCGRERDMIRG